MKTKPYIADWMTEEDRIDRSEIAVQIESVLNLKNYRVNYIEYFQYGNACVVGKLFLFDKLEPLVIKARKGDLDREFDFIRLMDGRIPVPKLIDYFKHDGFCFLIISNINSKMLNEYSKSYLLRDNVFFELGGMLRSIHITEHKDTCIPFYGKKMIKKSFKRIASAVEDDTKFSKNEILFIKKSLQYCGDNFQPVLCHGDFHGKNIFYDGSKITLIDPSPKVNDMYLDIAYFLSVYSTIHRKSEVFKQILCGYQKESVILNLENLVYAYCIALLVRLGQFYKKNDAEKYSQIISELRRLSQEGEAAMFN